MLLLLASSVHSIVQFWKLSVLAIYQLWHGEAGGHKETCISGRSVELAVWERDQRQDCKIGTQGGRGVARTLRITFILSM